MVSHREDILYVGDQKKNIYFFDQDIEILKKFGNLILERYPGHEVVACDNMVDLQDEVRLHKPSVLILNMNQDCEDVVLSFIKEIRSHNLLSKTPIIILGLRAYLEKVSSELEKWNVSFVPKAIRVPFFLGVLSSAVSEAESVKVDVQNLAKGDHLFYEGDDSDHLYIVKSGQFQIYREIKGDVFNIAKISASEIIGEMGIVDKSKRSASAVALEDCEVYVINIDNVESYLQSGPFWLDMILKSLITRLRETNAKIRKS